MSDLANLQKWLTSIIVRPGKLKDKIAAADKTYRLDNTNVISPSHLTSEERIHIYARGYVLRLTECIRADYPALLALLGEELFNTFAQGYLVRLPSHSPSLFDLGEKFPEFLKASQPTDQSQKGESMFDLPFEIALAERAKTEASRSRGLETIENSPISYSFFSLFEAPLKTSPCLQLLELQFEVITFIRLAERNQPADTPARKPNFIAVCRKNYAVNMHQLESWQWHFLKTLQDTHDQRAAITLAAERCKMPEDMVSANLMVWLPVAMDMGYVYMV